MRALGYAFAALLAVCAMFFPTAALAHSNDHGETKLFTNVTVESGEVVDGDLNVVFGDATIAGHVKGDVNVFGGSCTIVDGGQIDGQQNCVWNSAARALAPFVATSAGIGAFAEQDRKLFLKLASSAIVLLVFLLFPLRMRLALDRVERHPGLSALVGGAAAIAFFPVMILLIVTLVGIPLVFLEIAAVFAGVWLGTGAVALLVGRRLCELVMPKTTPSPLLALVLGLVVVSAAEIVPVFGWAVTAIVWMVGLGAAILAFIRSTGTGYAFERAPIGGPPMKTSI